MKTINAHEYEFWNLQQTAPLLRYREGDDFSEWRAKAKEKLTELLGLPLTACDPELSIEYTEERDGYTECRFTVQTEPGFYVPCYLLTPVGGGQYPLTVCLSGHGGGMHVVIGKAKREEDQKAMEEWPHRMMGLRAIREGRCALVIEARNFGESSREGYGISCTEAGKIAIIMGRTIIGQRVWDAMRILDAVAAQFSQVDMTDIVCTGNSGGGTATYYLACMDERITAAAPSCSICSYETSIAAMPHCLCNHIPGIRKYFEMGDLAGLIAPRILVVAAGQKDTIFPIEGTTENFTQIRLLYRAAGAEDRCALVVGEQGHFNYADHIWSKLHEMGV